MLTELLFDGTLTALTATQLAAILSCFVWSETSDRGMPKVAEDLEVTFGALRDAAKRVGHAQADAGMAVDVNGFMNSFRPDLMDSVTLWADGATFLQVRCYADFAPLHDVFETAVAGHSGTCQELSKFVDVCKL